MNQEEWLKKNFLDVSLDTETLQVYTVRKSIFSSLKTILPQFNGIVLDIGCGQMPYREFMLTENNKITKYIGLDIENSSIHDTLSADIKWDGNVIPLRDETINSAMATEVLEHCFDPAKTLSEINRVLLPDGLFFFTVPFLWPLHETPFDAYRYTPFSLNYLLEKTGFYEIEIKPLGGWHASMAQMLGLWATESELTSFKKKLAVFFAKKTIPWLLKNDIKKNEFGQHTMITGLYGVAKKRKV